MLNPMWSTVILLLCVTFIMLDHCSVLGMQSGRNINAKPFIPRLQQQQQQEQQQRQWQEDQEYLNLYGTSPHQYHHRIQQILPQNLDEPFYGVPSPPQYHQSNQAIQQFPEHLSHQFPSQHLGGHQQMVPSSPPQTFSPMHLAPMADHSSSSQLMSPFFPAHYERNEPVAGGGHVEESYEFDDLMKNVVDFAVESGENGARNKPIGHEMEQSRLNPFNTAFSSNDPLRHLTSLLQRIPQGTSLFSENPASIVGTSNKQLKEPLNPARVISPTPSESPQITDPSAIKEERTEKLMFGTIEDNILASMAKKVAEKPNSRGIPPGFPPKNSSGSGDAFPVKEVTKYSDAVKKLSAPPSTSKLSPKEVKINQKSPTVESEKTSIPGENVGKIMEAQKSKTNVSDDKISCRKHESSSSAVATSIKPDGASTKNKTPGLKAKEKKKNKTKQKDKVRTSVAPNEPHATIPTEFLPTNKGKQGKSQNCAENPSDSAAKKADDDEDLGASLLNKIKPDSKLEKEISGSSSDFIDAQDMGLEEEIFADALPFFETQGKLTNYEKKKSAKQLKREKELEDAKAIKEFAKKRELELKNAKGKSKAEETTKETNKEIDKKSAKNKEKFNAAKGLLELHKTTDPVQQDAIMKEWIRKWHPDEKNKATESTHTPSMRVESLVVHRIPVDHHTEIKTILNILISDKIKQISIDENHAKKDIRYLLYTVQVFYQALQMYWHSNYEFHDLNKYAYIGNVLNQIGQFYTDKWANEENVKLFERAVISLSKSMHILSNFWIILEYREFMESQVFSKDEGKYKFVKWMEAFEELLDALKLFNIKLKRFNRSNAKKNGSLDRLKAHFKKSTILEYFETKLNLKFCTVFGIVFIGMDEHNFGMQTNKKEILTGLKYLQNWMPDRKTELAHARKIMWNYFEIMDYNSEKVMRKDFKKTFQLIMGYPEPKGNYIRIEEGNYASNAVKSAESKLCEIFEMIRIGNRDKISPEVENALNAFKEHLHCANFLITMYEKIYWKFDDNDKINKHNVHMGIAERNFWHIVDKDKCIPAEENYRKIENSPKYQKFLQDHPSFKNTMEEALKSLEELFVKYNIEERRKEARGECDCCKPEEGYDKDSEEEKEELGKERKLEEIDKNKEKELVGKQEHIQVQEEPIKEAADNESVKSDREE